MCLKGMLDIQKSQMSQNQKKKSNTFAKPNKAKYNTLILTLLQMFWQELYCSSIYVLQEELQKHQSIVMLANRRTVCRHDPISLGRKNKDLYVCEQNRIFKWIEELKLDKPTKMTGLMNETLFYTWGHGMDIGLCASWVGQQTDRCQLCINICKYCRTVYSIILYV